MRFSLDRALAFSGLLALLAAYYSVALWRPVVPEQEGAVVGFFFEPASTSPQLIFPLVAILLWGRRRRLRAALGAAASPPSLFFGAVLFGGGVLLFLWSIYTESPDLQILSLMPTLLGVGLLLGGRELLRALALPTVLLVFALPPPAVLVNQIIFPMQMWTAKLAEGWLALLGIENLRQGEILLVGRHAFQVIESCSGFRSVETLLMATVVYLEVFRVRGVRAVLLLVAAPLVAFSLNSLRVLSIVLATDVEAATDHTLQGIVAISVGVLAVHGIDRLLARVIPDRRGGRRAQASSGERGAGASTLRIRSAFVVAVLVGMAVAPHAIDPWRPALRSPNWGVSLPAQWDGYASKALKPDLQFLGSVRFKPLITRGYENGSERVEVFLGYDKLLNRGHHPISPKIAIPGSGWEVLARGPAEVDGIPQAVEALVARSGNRAMLSYSWYVGTRSALQEALHSALALDRSPARNTKGVTAIRISTPLHGESGSLEAAQARLGGFARRLNEMVGEAHARLEGNT